MPTGILYLIPTPLAPDDDPVRVLPPATVAATVGLDYFIVEQARSARAVLGRLPMSLPIREIEIRELNRHTPAPELPRLLEPVLAGRNAGLVSEAGCPAVADPGAALVALAHRLGIRVVPLVGPSALLLALMASGMNGQAFSFAGYVPVDPTARAERLRTLERRSAADAETILLIETPYRNQALFDAMLEVLAGETVVGVAAELTLPAESIASRRVADWRGRCAELARQPTVFTLQALPRAAASAPGHAPRPPGAGRAPRPPSAGRASRRPR